jgi:hypothetical protein
VKTETMIGIGVAIILALVVLLVFGLMDARDSAESDLHHRDIMQQHDAALRDATEDAERIRRTAR